MQVRADVAEGFRPSWGASEVRRSALLAHASIGTLGLLIVVSPMLIGGAPGWAVPAVAAMAAAALLANWQACRSPQWKRVPVPLGWAWLAAVAWTGLQVAPLPCEWVAGLAPRASSIQRWTSEALNLPTSAWCTLTLDPGGTREELLKMAALLAAFLAGWLAAVRGERRYVIAFVAFSSAAMSAIALFHKFANMRRVFGLYAPVHGPQRFVAPLLNENNLAGFSAMGVPLALAMGLSSDDRRIRWMWFFGAALSTCTTLLTLSRGGVTTLGFALLASSMVIAFHRSRRTKRRAPSLPSRWWLLAGLGGAIAAGGALYLRSEFVKAELSRTDGSKLDVLREVANFVWAQPWTGVGRGAFSAAFVGAYGTRYRQVYAENFVLQWAAEWGVPFTVGLLLVIGWALWRSLRRARSLERRLALVALIALAAQGMVDFALELLGISVVAAALLGAVTAPAQSRRGKPVRWLRAQPLPVTALALCVTVLVLIGPNVADARVGASQTELSRYLRTGRSSSTRFERRLAQALQSHPAEPALTLLAAAWAGRERDPGELRWLSRTMDLAPDWSVPHVRAAKWLMSHRYPDQALLELREAAQRDIHQAARVLCEFAKQPRFASGLGSNVLSAAPDGPDGERFLDLVARCVDVAAPMGRTIDRALLERKSDLWGPHVRAARRLLTEGHPLEAAQALRKTVAQYPSELEPYTWLFRAEMERGRPDAGLLAIRRAQRNVKAPKVLLRLEARAHAELGDAGAMRGAIERLRVAHAGDGEAIAQVQALRGILERRLGHLGEALAAFRQAYRLHPVPEHLESVAATAEALGHRATALHAYSQLCDLQPKESSFCAKRDALRVDKGVEAWTLTGSRH